MIDGSSVGSIASRPSELADKIGSLPNVARSKNCRSAACRKLSYSAPTARAGGRFGKSHARVIGMINERMRRETLIDFFDDLSADRAATFLAYDNGFRHWTYTYADVARAARAFGARLAAAGIGKGDAVVFWSENRPEWVVAFWGCLLQGADRRAHRLSRLGRLPAARRGHRPRQNGARRRRNRSRGARRAAPEPPRWRLAEMDWQSSAPRRAPAIGRDDTAEIIFTSGATAEPKGVVITHANVLANIVPVEREVLKYRKYARPFSPIRFLNLLPLSHMFGQSMATFVPADAAAGR